MIIKDFNERHGISRFRESNLTTQLHAHPALELILAQEGFFTLVTEKQRLENITGALIPPNQSHAYEGENCTSEFIFIEIDFPIATDILAAIGRSETSEGVLVIEEIHRALLSKERLQHWCRESQQREIYDSRVAACMIFIQTHLDDNLLLPQLAKEVQLSPSRLSHLFKAQVGLPIQKYIIWTRMKVAIDLVIHQKRNLTEAALEAGFYDSAHFSKHFKEMLGVKPSLVYNNSRIVQG